MNIWFATQQDQIAEMAIKNLKPFDLRVGDRVEAKDIVFGHTYKWHVVFISEHIFVCSRKAARSGQKIYRSFQKTDYQRGTIERI